MRVRLRSGMTLDEKRKYLRSYRWSSYGVGRLEVDLWFIALPVSFLRKQESRPAEKIKNPGYWLSPV